MSFLGYSAAVLCLVLFASGAVSGADVKKAVGDEVSFSPASTIPTGASIIWKHRSASGFVTKVIEYDEDGVNIPNPTFRGITTLDVKTGKITIKDLTPVHSGVYTIDINSKEQEQRFPLNVMGVDVKKAVGDEVSFSPASTIPTGASIIWKHRSASGFIIKAIEYDEDGVNIPNPTFKGITTLDVKTGKITIKDLTLAHSGVYTIDINRKEQEQRFPLNVMERVPKPVIKAEKIPNNADVVYLRCEYSETIIWRNSDGETLSGSVITPIGESITVHKEGKPEKFYTCTLKNDVSEETSEPVYERDLFNDKLK